MFGLRLGVSYVSARLCTSKDERIRTTYDPSRTVCRTDAIGDTVWKKFEEYIVRQHVRDDLEVRYELFDKMRRDMAWACVERVLDMPGFFTMLAEIYKEGYFPCSWKGAHPSGQAVVL